MFAFAGFHLPRDGYGYATIKIGEALKAIGAPVDVVDLGKPRLDAQGVPLATWTTNAPTVVLCTPDWLPNIDTNGHPLIAHTMFEATRLPEGWVEKLNRYADRVIVPCAWNVDVFRDNGVTRPIDVVKWGVDPVDYPLLERTRTADLPYTFLWSGTPDLRKGWDVTYKAFRRAFGDREDVRLIMHFRQLPQGVNGIRDGNVMLVVGLLGRPVLRQMLQIADCFVFPSRGEGWGLPPREAASTGLPVIATDAHGLAEDNWSVRLGTVGMSPADYGPWGDVGEWFEPDGDQLVDELRWAVAHREAMVNFGVLTSAWMHLEATWERTARGILEIVNA